MVTLIGAGETLVNAANAHRDATLEADYRTYLAGMGISRVTSPSVLRSGEPTLVAEIDSAEFALRAEPALRPLVARLNVHSFVVVPIRGRESIIGPLSLLRSRAGDAYTADDLVLLQDIEHRAGLVIENARLYDDLERRVRSATDRRALEQSERKYREIYENAPDMYLTAELRGETIVCNETLCDRLDVTERDRPDVHNVDVMKLAGFCRNCLSKWYRAAAAERGSSWIPKRARRSTACRTTTGKLSTEVSPRVA